MSNQCNGADDERSPLATEPSGLERLRKFEETMRKINSLSPPPPKFSLRTGVWCDERCKPERRKDKERKAKAANKKEEGKEAGA